MITCSHARMLLCSHVITCLACDMCTWNIIFSHAYLWMLAWLFTCLDAYMLECFADHMLPCSHALLIICYYVACFEDNMHTYIDFHMFDIHTRAHTWLMICLHVRHLKWSCSYTSNVLKMTCSHAHIHWFSHVWYPHTCNTWLMICLQVRHLKWSCSCTFVCSNALTIMLECISNWAERGMCTFFLEY